MLPGWDGSSRWGQASGASHDSCRTTLSRQVAASRAHVSMTYKAHKLARLAGSHILAGSGDAASAISAEAKALAPGDILQECFQARSEEFDGSDIGQTEVKKAILRVRGKKHTKAPRKGVIATSKFSRLRRALARCRQRPPPRPQ